MSSYTGWERRLARLLEPRPGVRAVAKRAYHRVNYVLFRERGDPAVVHPGARVVTVAEWWRRSVREGERFFGYYHMTPWSPDMQAVLYHEPVGEPDGRGRVDVVGYDRGAEGATVWGSSTAWNYQQGSMAQWVPWSAERAVVFNDFVGGRLVARLVREGAEEVVVPLPVQALHPAKPELLSLNYLRLARLRPEYGYRGRAGNLDAYRAPNEDGLWRVDLDTGEVELLFSLAALAANAPRKEMKGAEHRVNHAVYSPAGTRFVFVHRWLGAAGNFSRLYVASSNGSELRLLLDDRVVSHFCWLDEDRLLAWARTAADGDRYYVIDVRSGAASIPGRGRLAARGDGHPSASPDRRWVVTDSSPDRARRRHLVLYDPVTDQCIEAGRFFAPWRFDGPTRCDLHPRWSPDGRMISIDSAHEGTRQSYFVNVGGIVAGDG